MPKKLSQHIFIQRAKTKHNNYYDYSKVVFKTTKDKVLITCPIHGDFLQSPEAHMRGQGCPKCGSIKNKSHLPKDTSIFIKQASEIHCNKYAYDKTIYKNCMSKVTITCPIHGDFDQIPNNHLRGAGCPKCAMDKVSSIKKLTTNDFIELATKIHGSKYDYSYVNYIKSKIPVRIVCSRHGIFEQTPDKHLKGQGCPKCSNLISNPEQKLVKLFKSFNIQCIQSDRSIIHPYELDIVLPKLKLAIEYCGLHWHSERALSRYHNPKNYHMDKYNKCKEKGIRLITVFEPEFLLKYDIVVSILLAQCNIYNYKFGARKCIIQEVPLEQAKVFLDENHIQGFAPGRYIGLFYKEELVSLLVMFEYNDYYNLVRFVNKKYTVVHGSFSKLFKYFLKIKKDKPIITFADKRYFTGNVYVANGFKFVHEVPPSYYYFSNSHELLHKRNFQHKKLKKIFNNYDPNKTEYQNCLANGYDRIWDCGKIKYIYE